MKLQELQTQKLHRNTKQLHKLPTLLKVANNCIKIAPWITSFVNICDLKFSYSCNISCVYKHQTSVLWYPSCWVLHTPLHWPARAPANINRELIYYCTKDFLVIIVILTYIKHEHIINFKLSKYLSRRCALHRLTNFCFPPCVHNITEDVRLLSHS